MTSATLGHVVIIFWLYLSFYKLYNNQTWQDGKPAYSDFMLQVAMTSFPLGHVNNLYGFMSIL